MRISNRYSVLKCFAVMLMCVCVFASLVLCVDAKPEMKITHGQQINADMGNYPLSPGFDMDGMPPADGFDLSPDRQMPPSKNGSPSMPQNDMGSIADGVNGNGNGQGRTAQNTSPAPNANGDASQNEATDSGIVFGVVIAILSAVAGVIILTLLLSKRKRIK